MIEVKLSEPDMKKIETAFGNVPDAFKGAAREVATRLRKLTVGRTTYVTGTLQRGWSEISESVTTGGLSFSYDNPVDYGPTLELGAYPAEGPRTMAAQTQKGESGIFSRGTVKDGVGGMIGPNFAPDVLEGLGSMVVAYMKGAMHA